MKSTQMTREGRGAEFCHALEAGNGKAPNRKQSKVIKDLTTRGFSSFRRLGDVLFERKGAK